MTRAPTPPAARCCWPTRTAPGGTAPPSPRRCRSWARGFGCRPPTPTRYVVQAAIAACHALAPSWDETDWAAIESWYEVLLRVDDGPVVRLNHAVAVAEARGPQQGLDLVDAIEGLHEYPLLARDPGRAAAPARPDRRGGRGRRPGTQPAAQRGAARPARPLSVGAPVQDIVVPGDNSLLEYA